MVYRIHHCLALLVLAAGCGDQFHDDYQLVEGLRLLAVVADPPEAAAGQVAHLEAVAANVSGAAITYRWGVCTLAPLPGSGTVNPDCTSPSPPDAGLEWLPVNGALVDLPVPALPDETLGPVDATGGRYLPVRVDVTSGGETLVGLYRLRTGGGGAPNNNPALASIEVTSRGGVAWNVREALEVAAGDTLTLRAVMRPEAAEDYRADLGGGVVRDLAELISISWFSDAGKIDPGSTGDGVDTTLDLGRGPAPRAGTGRLWVVARDGRGGTTVASRSYSVR